MAKPRAGLTVLVQAGKSGMRRLQKVRYSPEQLERMRLAKQVWAKTRSLLTVARALGVSRERARQILDRGAALGLYGDRRHKGPGGSTIHPQAKESASMPNLGKMITSEVLRLARRASSSLMDELRQDIRQHRRLIAALRGEVASLSRDRKTLMEDLGRRIAQPPEIAPAELKRARLGPRSILAQRRRLGLTRRDFARLVGIGAVSVSKWESGKFKPSTRGRAALIAVRQLGRREARRRLAALGHSPSRAKGKAVGAA